MQKHDRRQPAGAPREGRIGSRPFAVVVFAVIVRALHQIGAAVFLAAYLLDVAPPPLFIHLAVYSGALLVFTEWMRHRQLYREFSGISTLLKVALLGLAFHGIGPETVLVTGAFLLASIGSHAPKPYRHRLLF